MNAPADDRSAEPWRLLVLWGGGCVLGIITYGVLIEAPLDQRALALAKERDTLQKTCRELEITVAKLDEFQRDWAALGAKRDIANRILPAEQDDAEVRAALAKGASETRVELLRVTTGSPEPVQHTTIAVPAEIEARGRLVDLTRFVGGMDRREPVMQTRRFVIAREGRTYRAQGSIAAFFYQAPSPPPRQRR